MSTPSARPSAVLPILGLLVLALVATTAQPAQAQPRADRSSQHARDESMTAPTTTALTAPSADHGAGRDATKVIAHRGASAYAPENTLAAVRLGIAMDADLVEVDVQQSKDHELVVMHDETLERTTNVEKVFPDRAPWRVGDFTLAELRKLDAGKWKADEYAGAKVPTLDEVLLTLQDAGVGLMLEAKEPALHPGVGKRIVEKLHEYPYWRNALDASRLLVVSFDWEFQRKFRELAPDYAIGLIGTPEKSEIESLSTWAEYVDPRYKDLTKDLLDAIHDAGMESFTWTLTDPDHVRKAHEVGIDGIVTNNPDVVREQLREEGAA